MASASTLAGQTLGAGKPERTERAPRTAALLGLAVAVPIGSLFLTIPERLLAIFGIDDPSVLAIGEQLLGYLSVSGLFLLVALVYTGALQGTGDTRGPFYITLVSQLALPIAVCATIDALGDLRAGHIWSAILAGHATRCVLSVLRFRQGRWREIEVE